MIVRFFSFCLCLLLLSACKKEGSEEDQTALVVITSPDNAPFEFKNTAKGGDEIIGFDMDLVKKLGERLGRPIKVIESDFSALMPSLQSGRADMVISTLGATDERRKSVDFSDPYYQNKSALLVREDSSIDSEKSLSSKVLGVQTGSAHETAGYTWVKTIPQLSIVSLTKVGELVQELKNARIDAIRTEGETARQIAASTPGLKVVFLQIPGEDLVIAFPKGSPWVKVVNEKLKMMKKDIQALATQWLEPQ